MAISGISPIGAGVGAVADAARARAGAAPAAPGFGEALSRGLAEVSGLEQAADNVAQNLASGGGAQVHDLMIASTKASVGVELLSAVRNRAVEAYQEVMRLQI